MHALSGGAFCITLEPVLALWDFHDSASPKPTDEQLAEALQLVDDDRLVLSGDRMVTLPAGMAIDLGGIAKGYIADKIAGLVQYRVSGAVLNFGGNVYVVGLKPNGSLFNVGIRDPQGDAEESLLVFSCSDTAVVTSGIYERYVEYDGVRYHHILDPETGSSAMNDLASATIVSESSLTADAIATVCMVLGSEKALAFLQENGYDGLLITRDNQVLTTENYPYQIRMMK